MSGLKAEVDPAEVGLDAERLGRIDRTFARYVDAGRLPGYLVTVSRHGKLAHVSGYGARDREEGLAVESDTLWRIFSMTKPITSVAAMMLYEEGALQLTGGSPLACRAPIAHCFIRGVCSILCRRESPRSVRDEDLDFPERTEATAVGSR